MNIQEISFGKYLKIHNTIQNPSAETLRVQYNDTDRTPSFETFMENMKARQDTVR